MGGRFLGIGFWYEVTGAFDDGPKKVGTVDTMDKARSLAKDAIVQGASSVAIYKFTKEHIDTIVSEE
jgi:hypothetical protein